MKKNSNKKAVKKEVAVSNEVVSKVSENITETKPVVEKEVISKPKKVKAKKVEKETAVKPKEEESKIDVLVELNEFINEDLIKILTEVKKKRSLIGIILDKIKGIFKKK